MHNQHAGLSQQLAAQRIAERHQQAAQARLAQHAGRSRRRRHRWRTRRWWQLARRPGTALTRTLLIGAMGAAMHLAANATPAQAPAPAPPNQRGPSDRLVAWLGGLVAALALAGGLGVHAARRTRRRARLEHAA
jgi:hypothetical protein